VSSATRPQPVIRRRRWDDRSKPAVLPPPAGHRLRVGWPVRPLRRSDAGPARPGERQGPAAGNPDGPRYRTGSSRSDPSLMVIPASTSPQMSLGPSAVSSRRCRNDGDDAGVPRRPDLVRRLAIPVVPSRMRDKERAGIAGFAMRREFTSRGCRSGPRGGSDPDRRHEGRVRETSRAAVGLIIGPVSAPGRQVQGRSCLNIPAAGPTASVSAEPLLVMRSRAGGDDGPSYRGRTGCRRARHPPSHVPVRPTAMARCSTSRRAAIGRLMREKLPDVGQLYDAHGRPRRRASSPPRPARAKIASPAMLDVASSADAGPSRRGDRQPKFRPSGRGTIIEPAVRVRRSADEGSGRRRCGRGAGEWVVAGEGRPGWTRSLKARTGRGPRSVIPTTTGRRGGASGKHG
jgi:hypothetical protein